jgi:hypothetical protein
MTHKTTPASAPNRRDFLAQTAAVSTIIISGTALINQGEAWGLEAKNLKPETMRTLIKLARDIYPHDRLADRFYAEGVKSFDAKAGTDPKTKTLIETGVAALDKSASAKHRVPYAAVGWEAERVALLKAIETTPFFQAVRGTLVVSLYNQKELWPLFGYEGESAIHGGYINRGFNDLKWL